MGVMIRLVPLSITGVAAKRLRLFAALADSDTVEMVPVRDPPDGVTETTNESGIVPDPDLPTTLVTTALQPDGTT